MKIKIRVVLAALALLTLLVPSTVEAQQAVPVFQSKSPLRTLLNDQTLTVGVAPVSNGKWISETIDTSSYAEAFVLATADSCSAGQGGGGAALMTMTANDPSSIANFQITNHPNTVVPFGSPSAASIRSYAVTGFGKYTKFVFFLSGSLASCPHVTLSVIFSPLVSTMGTFGTVPGGTKVITQTFPVVMGGIDVEQSGNFVKELHVDSNGNLVVTGSVTSSAAGLGSGSNSKLLLKGNAVDVTAGVVHTAVEVVNGGGAPIYCTIGPTSAAGAPDAGAWIIDNGRPVPAGGGSWALDTTLGMYCASPVDQSADAGSTRVTTGGK